MSICMVQKLKFFLPIFYEISAPVVILRTGAYNNEIKKQLIDINKTAKFL